MNAGPVLLRLPARARYFAPLGLLLALGTSPAQADLSRLQSLLDSIPAGGWVQVNTTAWSTAWPTGSQAITGAGDNISGVVNAWSSFVWDSTSEQLLLWGGGHGNYKGNEMYVWDAQSGAWTRGSLPSRLDASDFVVDNAAPQSSHTYDNSVYLRANNMYMTYGGAAYNSGGTFATNIDGEVSRAGPWLWDPTKANPNLVGGTSGSGYDASTPGGDMWINRWGSFSGTPQPNFLEDTTAYRMENGKDVVYSTSDSQGSGWAVLYRYEFGDVRQGGTDSLTAIGVSTTTPSGLGAASIDSQNNLYVRTAASSSAAGNDLVVWDLSKSNAANPNLNRETGIRLIASDGSDFAINGKYGLDYDSANNRLLLWAGGDVFSTQALFDTNGALQTTWIVSQLSSTNGTQPGGEYSACVCGKWQYIEELDAMMALDQYNPATGDAGVWLYKAQVGAVPEIPSSLGMTLGLASLLGLSFIRRKSTNLQ